MIWTTMKLFAFKPRIRGPVSFYVMANDEQEARSAIEVKIAGMDEDDRSYFEAFWRQLSLDEHGSLHVFDPGEVAVNEHDYTPGPQ